MPKQSVLIFALAVAAIGGWAYWVLSADEKSAASTSIPDANVQRKNSNALANAWRWNSKAGPAEKDSPAHTSPPTNAPPTNVAIDKIMRNIKLDENGLVAPDEMLKEALEEVFETLGPGLSAREMSELQKLMRIRMPGPAGDGAAQILGNYYQYRLAEAEFNRQLENQLLASEPQMNRAKEHRSFAADSQGELMQLRRNFLGKEVADKLFAVEDIQARHMLAAIAIEQNTDLTAEEKRAEQEALQDRLNDRQLALGRLPPEEAAAEKVQRLRERGATSADIYSARKSILGAERANELAAADREQAQWENRFNGFWQARRYVMQAGLDEAERERQIEQLFEQYFRPEERERARITNSEWQVRDAHQAMN